MNAGKILKADTVQMRGTHKIDLNAPAVMLQEQPVPSQATPQVRIVEKHDGYAVLEVTCGCGTKSYVQCNYDN